MQQMELDALVEEIERYLHRPAQSVEGCTADSDPLAYWRNNPSLSRAEIGMLAALADAPACLDTIAQRLGRTPAGTAHLLAALEAVGLIERTGSRYAVTPVTEAYLALLDLNR